MFSPGKQVLDYDNVDTIVEHLKKPNSSYITIYGILVRGMQKLDPVMTEPNIFAIHQSQINKAVEFLTNDQLIQSKQKQDENSDEECLLSVENALKERLDDSTLKSSHVIIQKCLDEIQKYVDYNDKLNGKTLNKNQQNENENVPLINPEDENGNQAEPEKTFGCCNMF